MKYIGRFFSIFVFLFFYCMFPLVIIGFSVVVIFMLFFNYMIAGNVEWTSNIYDKVIFEYGNFVENMMNKFIKFFDNVK